MRASLDTNVIIHFYRAGLQNIMFDFFKDGVFIYEQIRNVELENHGQDILKLVDEDIAAGKIEIYTNDKLRNKSVFKIFENNVRENKLLYDSGDMGEVYAIALAQTLGTYSLVTDDIKHGGPYMSLLQIYDDIQPFNFADILIIRYLMGTVDEYQTVEDFNNINEKSELNWSFRSHLKRFIRRFFTDPDRTDDYEWMQGIVDENGIKVKSKFERLRRLVI